MTLLEDVREARENYQDLHGQIRRIRERIEKSDPGTKRRLELKDKQEATKEALERAEKIKLRLVKALKERREDAKKIIESTAPGAPHWAGCRFIMDEIVVPELVEDHVVITRRKSPASHPLSQQNPGSDHNEANVRADAVDGAIANAHTLADEIGGELGVGDVVDFVSETFVVEGHRFRVQIIAGTHGTGPHIHIGLLYLGRA
jgi:hypothetical protein